MLRGTVIVSLMVIASALCTSFSCDSCGSECAPACGTRRFRLCCFNYLRKKRQDHFTTQNIQQPKLPMFVIDDFPETWNKAESNDWKLYPNDWTLEDVLH